ncbi:predicted protein [Botrytis cinerea T4]|uniref:Uncharacterized protein n=1 Tax=Botryotinia fuckeliana (strain T4) TaxID=999810 RepID=G2XWB9_BOTF4|nr:predicted protein [Botrytis cinerea T4]
MQGLTTNPNPNPNIPIPCNARKAGSVPRTLDLPSSDGHYLFCVGV